VTSPDPHPPTSTSGLLSPASWRAPTHLAIRGQVAVRARPDDHAPRDVADGENQEGESRFEQRMVRLCGTPRGESEKGQRDDQEKTSGQDGEAPRLSSFGGPFGPFGLVHHPPILPVP
jgi:hypothetical protein